MQKKTNPFRYGRIAFAAIWALGWNFGAMAQNAPTYTLKVLYTFCAQNGCTDGLAPLAGLIKDSAGNLYGTTYDGGEYPGCYAGLGCGVVFKLAHRTAPKPCSIPSRA